jgi:hypothetical protein
MNGSAWRACGAALLAAGLISVSGFASATTASHQSNKAPFCVYLGAKYEASTGAWALCQGVKHTRASGRDASLGESGHPVAANVDAASLAEDITSAGVRAYGQSGPSVAAAGEYVVEAWSDATGLYAQCPSADYKEELTGFGFSANGGSSFTDLGGLPNNCINGIYGGDPSVDAYVVGGHVYFYILSMYDSSGGLGPSDMALAACQASGSGSSARLHCGQPDIVATSNACQSLGEGVEYCNFLDKGSMAIDPARGRLYVSYSEFPEKGNDGSSVELAVCDLGNALGGPGPAGGTPAAPVCENGARQAPAPSYLTIARPDPNGCESEGAYPAVDVATGAVYVSYEYNWGTNISGAAVPPCGAIPTTEVMTRVPLRCLPLAQVSPCKGPAAKVAVPVVSMAAADIPGFDGVPNDFPKPAVSDGAGTVSMVWNDARYDPLGDILLQSFSLTTLAPVQAAPVLLDRPTAGGLNMLPALRAGSDGLLDVSWYARTCPSSVATEVVAALGVDPRTLSAPRHDELITTAGSNWTAVSTDLTPSFGDYTDSSLVATGTAPYVGNTLFIAWTDGRLGVPQPFSAHVPAA